jgi:hypothetical protein
VVLAFASCRLLHRFCCACHLHHDTCSFTFADSHLQNPFFHTPLVTDAPAYVYVYVHIWCLCVCTWPPMREHRSSIDEGPVFPLSPLYPVGPLGPSGPPLPTGPGGPCTPLYPR